jgi:hypothetical protein
MTELTAGKRLRSNVSDTEVIVIRPPTTAVVLCCGDHPMSAEGAPSAAPKIPPEAAEPPGDPDHAVVLGKRYVDEESGLEVLCTKPGTGPLAADGRHLVIKAPKALPASD